MATTTISALPDMDEIPRAPTDDCNWLLPHRLLIGARPSKADIHAVRAAGVDTIVCLLEAAVVGDEKHYRRSLGLDDDEEEEEDVERSGSGLPRKGVVSARATAFGGGGVTPHRSSSNSASASRSSGDEKQAGRRRRRVSVIMFPVGDFCESDPARLADLLLDLRTKILEQGRCVFVHCRGGHGRSGMVAIPLIALLLHAAGGAAGGDISLEEIQEHVEQSTFQHRASDQVWYARYGPANMPETHEQLMCARSALSIALKTLGSIKSCSRSPVTV